VGGSEYGTHPYFSFYGFEISADIASDILKNKK